MQQSKEMREKVGESKKRHKEIPVLGELQEFRCTKRIQGCKSHPFILCLEEPSII